MVMEWTYHGARVISGGSQSADRFKEPLASPVAFEPCPGPLTSQIVTIIQTFAEVLFANVRRSGVEAVGNCHPRRIPPFHFQSKHRME